MDGNKDDALKCLNIGREAFEAGEFARALKFLNKARKLDPHLPIDDLLSAIETHNRRNPNFVKEESATSSTQTSNQDAPSIRRRFNSDGGTSSASSSPAYTAEHASIVRQIRKEKGYYEILGLQRNCSLEDVRKAYRKLSLKVHPDKNKAPGAEDAFKAVSKAFQCLSDEERRKSYDLVGSEEEAMNGIQRSRHRTNGMSNMNGFYDVDIDPDEIFRNFFSGMGPTTFTTFNFGNGVGRRTEEGQHGSGPAKLRVLIQLLPVLLILLLNFLPSSEPSYSLSKKYPYDYRHVTQKGVTYYVKDNFQQKHPPGSDKKAALENDVDAYYYRVLESNCQLELQRYHFGFVRDTPHCDLLRQFQTVS